VSFAKQRSRGINSMEFWFLCDECWFNCKWNQCIWRPVIGTRGMAPMFGSPEVSRVWKNIVEIWTPLIEKLRIHCSSVVYKLAFNHRTLILKTALDKTLNI
jgi:hypothetical protein